MLSKDQIEILTDEYMTKLYDDLERETIADIARRVKKMERFTETAELQAMAMREQGYSPSKIQQQVFKILNADKAYQRQLAENTREYKQEIKKIIEETEVAAGRAGDQLVATAGDMAWNDDMQAWRKHGVDLKKPNGLQQLYAGIAKQTNGELKNITQSTGFKGTTLGTTGVLNAYRRTMDLATLKMSTGSFSYQTAVKDCIDQLAKSGLRTIDYASGRSYQLDTAARMCIRTGANQLSGKIQELNLAETDTPLVYVDAHAGSRPEHAVWQGQVYAYNPDGILRDGSKAGEKYDDFFHATDYGSVTGLMGANCAHHFYPYWEGDPIPEYEEPDPIRVGEKEYTYYEATQEMRRQERGIRETKRRIEAMNALGEDSTQLTKKLAKQEKEYRVFSKKANINPRNYVLSVKPGTSAAPKTSQSPVNSPAVNKNGKEIIFEERHTKIERVAQMQDKQKEIISNLSNEYNTRLERVTGGAFENHAAGDVSMDGTQMRLTDSHINTAMHEFAHTLASTDGDKYGLTNDKAFWAEIRKIRTEYRKAVRKDHSLSISSYADGSDKLDEFMCEAFTQAKAKKMGIELPSAFGKDTTYSDKVLDVVDRYFAKKPLVNSADGSKSEYGTTSAIKRIGDNKVDLAYIRSSEYIKKYDSLSNNKDLNKTIYEKAKVILTENNGTDTEITVVLSNGSPIVNQKGEKDALGVSLNSSQLAIIRNNKNKVGIHNHPTNLPPNGSDFVAAGSRGYDFGVVVTHDGKVIKYSTGNKPFTSEALNRRIDKYCKKEYNLTVEEAYAKALDEFKKEYGISWQIIE